MGLAKRFKGGRNTSGGYISANVVENLPLINVRF